MKPRSADEFINGADAHPKNGKAKVKQRIRYNIHVLRESKTMLKDLVRHFEKIENIDLSAGEILDRIIGAEYERLLGDKKDE